MKELTARQHQVLLFIKEYLAKKSYPPTIRDIADHFLISTKGAYDHIKALQRKGVISCGSNRSRTIELLNQHSITCSVSVPLLHQITTSQSIFLKESSQEEIDVPPSMVKKGDRCFAIKVVGDSMINAAIIDGDIAIFTQQHNAVNSDIVLALVSEEITIKRFFNEGNRIRLQPENSTMSPIYTTDAKIVGKIVGILRYYN